MVISKKIIRSIPDFPKRGVVFRDITPLLSNGEAFRHSVDLNGRPFLFKE
ncbi:MAG: hypothetical protein U5N58_07775 [Actinomycetota bacterium]|nr:hypothetical protein [Actinomycetota bacterium]